MLQDLNRGQLDVEKVTITISVIKSIFEQTFSVVAIERLRTRMIDPSRLT
jgi:hypothetical protein